MKTENLENYPSGKPDELIAILCGKMADRVVREIPEPGDSSYFADFAQCGYLPESEFARAMSVFVERDEQRPGTAFLGFSLLHPRVAIDASVYLKHGSKYELSEYLKNCESEKMMSVYHRLTESLRKND